MRGPCAALATIALLACGSEDVTSAGAGGGVGGIAGMGNAGAAGSFSSGGAGGVAGAGGSAGTAGGAGGLAGSSGAASGGAGGSGSCALAGTPKVQTLFTQAGTTQDLRIEDELVRLLEGAVPGSKVRIAVFTFTRQRMADAILAAHARGVDVRVVVDADNYVSPGVLNGAVGKLSQGLPAPRLYVCSGGGCIGTNINHNKLLTFSQLCDGSKNVVVQSSANFTNSQLKRHNNAIVVRDDLKLYEAFVDYWQVLRDETLSSSNASSPYAIRDGSNGTRAYFFPRKMGSPAHPDTDTIVSFLENVSCDPNSDADWVGVVASLWSAGRGYVLATLAALEKAGCRIEIAVDEDVAHKSQIVTAFPKARLVAGQHSKYLLINARYAGSSSVRSLVWTGSHNLTVTSLRSNDEAIVRIEDPAVFKSYAANFAQLK